MKLAAEVSKSHEKRLKTGFYERFMSGSGLDIGFRGYEKDVSPVVPNAIGVELGDQGYDGLNLNYRNGSVDFVFSSHVLEHILDYKSHIKEWHRVLRCGGHMIIIVPHWHLYEKRATLPSQFNTDHKRFYTPSSLLKEIEESLDVNSYRVDHLRDNDDGYNYAVRSGRHAWGCYEIECVIRKIEKPEWELLPWRQMPTTMHSS